MLDYTSFERVFPSIDPFPYDRHSVENANAHRKALDGALFIDRVLRALGLPAAVKSYPPKSEQVLRQLHQAIVSSQALATHHKLSVLYYVLLDVDSLSVTRTRSSSSLSRSSAAEEFASASGVPSKYSLFMKGLWYLDRGEFRLALEFLAHPSLIPEFPDDIISVLVRNTKDGDYSIPLAYYYAVQPVLKSNTALELLFEAMAKSSVTEALLFSRSKPESMREKLFQSLVAITLEGTGDEAASRAFELASLPFDANEAAWFEEFLSSGQGKRLKGAKDTLLMRRIALGQAGSVGEKGTWGVVLEGFKAGSGGRS